MWIIYNPFTKKLDFIWSWWGGTWEIPQTGAVSPEGVATPRYAGDQYLNTVSGILYTNPNASGVVGREIVQTSPAG